MQVLKQLSALLVVACFFHGAESRSHYRGLQKAAKEASEEPVNKAAEKAALKKDKTLDTTTVSAPSASPVAPPPVVESTPSPSSSKFSTPTASPTSKATDPPVVVHKFTMLPTVEESIAWTVLLEVDPPTVSRNLLKDALEQYLGPTTAHLSLVPEETTIFTVESKSQSLADHEKAIHNRPRLQQFLQQLLNRDDLLVTNVKEVTDDDKNSIINDKSSVVELTAPNRGLLVSLIVSLIFVALVLVSIMYIVPCLQFRREQEEEWTFSEEREVTFMQGTSA